MASTYSPSLKLTLIGDGDQSGIWGQTTNTNLGTLIEQAITGVTSIVMSNANYTLTDFNGAVDESRSAVLVVTGANSAIRNVIPPVVQKLYTIVNNTSGGFAIRVIGATGTGVLVANGTTQNVYCDGANFIVASGAFTNGEVLNVASGGTGLTTLTANNVILGNGASSPTFVAPSTTGNLLTSNGTTWVSTPPEQQFPSGTRMTFNQTSAPPGWTKDTSTNNAGFRLVSGSTGSGGTVDFTTAFTSFSVPVTIDTVIGSAGATTLSTPQIPSHTHSVNTFANCCGSPPNVRVSRISNGVSPVGIATEATGGGQSHTHPFSFSSGSATTATIDLAVKYVDLIIAQKN
jgi:hypothetical protein